MIKNVMQEIVCDECEKTSIIVKTDEKKLALETHGWKVIENPPMCKGMGKHICPDCVEKNKNLIKSIKICVDRGEINNEYKQLEIKSKNITEKYFIDAEEYIGINSDTLKKLIENFEFEYDKLKGE